MRKWMLGTYQFTANPNELSMDGTFVSDNLVTLSGRVITQPTAVRERYNLKAIIHQKSTRLLDTVSTGQSGLVSIVSDGSTIFFGASNGTIYTYDLNMHFKTSWGIGISPLVSLTCDSTKLYSLVGTGTAWTVYISPIAGGAFTASWSLGSVVSTFVGIAYLNGFIYCMTDIGAVYKLNTVTGALALAFSLSSIVSGGLYKDVAGDGTYLWAMETSGYKRTFCVATTGNVVTGIPNRSSAPTGLSYSGDKIVYVDTNNFIRVKPNTTPVDVYTIEQVVKSGQFQMTDEYGMSYRVAPMNFSVRRLKGYEDSYEIDLGIALIG